MRVTLGDVFEVGDNVVVVGLDGIGSWAVLVYAFLLVFLGGFGYEE